MGTRGFIGVVADEVEKIAYVHWDAYPSGLGADTLTWLRSAAEDIDALAAAVRKLRVVDSESTPNAADIDQLRQYADTSVGEQDLGNWYCLLRRTQGDLGAILEAGVVEDDSDFPTDSLFAEWGYLVDIDAGEFQVYQGFQTAPHDKGRFADRQPVRDNVVANTAYHPVALVKTWPLADLPSDEDFIKSLDDD